MDDAEQEMSLILLKVITKKGMTHVPDMEEY
jgi:hypothetical protein